MKRTSITIRLPQDAVEGMTITQETLNHLLGGAVATQFCMCPPNGLHIMFQHGTILAVYATGGTLDIDIMGPPVAESPNVERQMEVEG